MNRGSSLVECIVALLITSSAAYLTAATLLTCSTVERQLGTSQRLSEIAQSVDGIQSAEPTYAPEILEEAIAQRIARAGTRCKLDRQASELRCEVEQLKRRVPIFVAQWGHDGR